MGDEQVERERERETERDREREREKKKIDPHIGHERGQTA